MKSVIFAVKQMKGGLPTSRRESTIDFTEKSILSPTDSSFSKEPIAVSLLLTLASFGKGGGTAKP